MTLEDKIRLCEGQNFWETKPCPELGLPSIFMSDGPHGLRKQELSADHLGINESVPATCFPTAVTTANSWDPALLEEVGRAIAGEAARHGVGVVLGPGVNLKRNPLCGRNFEYFSEDPLLAGKLAAGLIRGMQGRGIAACAKHFACNSQEYRRFQSDSIIDERTLREMYLTAFEIAVKEGKPGTVMCAYNKINGTYASDNRELLTGILREEWGFEGLVMTDWAAMNDRVQGFKAGCDLSMPGGSGYMVEATRDAVKAGVLDEKDIDLSVSRVAAMVKNAQAALENREEVDEEAHHALARKAAEQGAVLLKNAGGILPLKEGQRLAVLGNMAEEMRYQGAGSSHVNPTRLSEAGKALSSTASVEDAEAVILLTGLPPAYESEGFDREHLRLPEEEIRLIEDTAKKNPRVIVVLFAGAPVEAPWADQVQAVLYMGLPGQAGGEALANLLFGRANPSGKLAETWPMRYEDCPSAKQYGSLDAVYSEGVFVGYRHYDSRGVAPRWPFGHGVSYTNFEVQGAFDEKGRVAVTVRNTGERAGAAVVQLYITPPKGSQNRPVKELKRFAKVFLEAGESQNLVFQLDERCFAVWDGGWKTPSGEYGVLVGEQPDSLSPVGAVQKTGLAVQLGAPWEALKAPVRPEARKGQFTMNSSVAEMMPHSLTMKFLHRGITKMLQKGAKPGTPEYRMMIESSVYSPLRSVAIASGMKAALFEGFLDIANGKRIQGLKKLLKARKA